MNGLLMGGSFKNRRGSLVETLASCTDWLRCVPFACQLQSELLCPALPFIGSVLKMNLFDLFCDVTNRC